MDSLVFIVPSNGQSYLLHILQQYGQFSDIDTLLAEAEWYVLII